MQIHREDEQGAGSMRAAAAGRHEHGLALHVQARGDAERRDAAAPGEAARGGLSEAALRRWPAQRRLPDEAAAARCEQLQAAAASRDVACAAAAQQPDAATIGRGRRSGRARREAGGRGRGIGRGCCGRRCWRGCGPWRWWQRRARCTLPTLRERPPGAHLARCRGRRFGGELPRLAVLAADGTAARLHRPARAVGACAGAAPCPRRRSEAPRRTLPAAAAVRFAMAAEVAWRAAPIAHLRHRPRAAPSPRGAGAVAARCARAAAAKAPGRAHRAVGALLTSSAPASRRARAVAVGIGGPPLPVAPRAARSSARRRAARALPIPPFLASLAARVCSAGARELARGARHARARALARYPHGSAPDGTCARLARAAGAELRRQIEARPTALARMARGAVRRRRGRRHGRWHGCGHGGWRGRGWRRRRCWCGRGWQQRTRGARLHQALPPDRADAACCHVTLRQ